MTNNAPLKATLEFDLSTPDGQIGFEQAVNAYRTATVLRQLDEELRQRVKYAQDVSEQERETYSKVRTLLYDLCRDNESKLLDI